nr:hypothetical protein [Tanacetum cinerariifolium]
MEDEIFFNQSRYIKEMLKKFGLEDSKPTKTPMSTKIKLIKDDEADSMDSSKYRANKFTQTVCSECDFRKDHIDLEDEVVSLLEKEKANLETIKSLKSKGFESSENVIFETENQSENECHVVEKECDEVENPKVIAPGMFKLSVSQSVSLMSMSKTSCDSKNVETKLKRKRRTVRFGNNDFAMIAGYGDVVIGSTKIKKMMIEQYFLMTDYSLWEVILNGDSPAPTRVIKGVFQPVAPTTAEQRLARKNELKAHGEKRFGGNKETKKVQKTLLKQQYENFTGSSSKNLDQIHDRLLPFEWRTHTLIWKNKTDLDEQSLDDLFNSLKIYEAEVKSSSSTSTSTQNIAFVSSQTTDNTNEPVSAVASVSAASAKIHVSALSNVDALSNARTRRNLRANGPNSIGFDMSKVECFNFHKKGHFARECRQKKNQLTMPSWHSPLQVLLVLTISSETDESLPASPICDRNHSEDGYHVVPPHYIVKFMPPKPDLVFHDAPNVNETDHTAFNVKLSPTKPDKSLSHTHRPSALIIKDWVSDSEDDSEAEIPQNTSSFVQPTEQVKPPRSSVKAVEISIPTANHKTVISKLKSHGNRKNRKACFDPCTKGNHQQYARMKLPNPQRQVVPTAVLTKSKLVSITAARPVTAAVLKTYVTRPRPAKFVVTKPHSPPRRHINRSQSPKPSNFSPIVSAAKAPMVNVVKGNWGNPQHALKDKVVIDSGCSRYMTRNMSYLSDFEELNGGYVAFGGNPKGGKIYGKDTECIFLSHEFKLPDENQVLLRVHRENNSYNVDLKNIVSSGDLTCLFVKATLNESHLWHRRLGHINFKTMNKLVKGNLVRGLLSKVFENNHTYVACKKGKQHRASCKTKPGSSVSQPLQRSDNETEFKNNDINQLCGMKGIKMEFSVPRTPQQNGIAKRKNQTLIEAVRTMLEDSLLPILFWAEAVNTACYVQNRVLVTKPQNKTLMALIHPP